MEVLRRPESIPPRFVSFAWRYRGCARRFAPTVYGRPHLWAWTIGHPEPSRESTAEISGFSQVPGRTPLCTCPGLIPRGILDARPVRRRGGSLPLVPQRRLPDLSLSRLIYHGLHTRCLRFEAAGYPDATQDSLPVGGQPLPGRTWTYWVHDEGFQVLSNACSFLPSQASPGARRLFCSSPPVRGALSLRLVRRFRRGVRHVSGVTAIDRGVVMVQ
jgi:hypothetical protein